MQIGGTRHDEPARGDDLHIIGKGAGVGPQDVEDHPVVHDDASVGEQGLMPIQATSTPMSGTAPGGYSSGGVEGHPNRLARSSDSNRVRMVDRRVCAYLYASPTSFM